MKGHMRKNYAYGVTVGGQKRVGGTMSADSMEDAVRCIARSLKMTIKDKGSVIRPCDMAVIQQADWMFEGQRASLYVWAPPEYFVESL